MDRQRLIDFLSWYKLKHENYHDDVLIEIEIDDYLKSIDQASDETKIINENETNEKKSIKCINIPLSECKKYSTCADCSSEGK